MTKKISPKAIEEKMDITLIKIFRMGALMTEKDEQDAIMQMHEQAKKDRNFGKLPMTTTMPHELRNKILSVMSTTSVWMTVREIADLCQYESRNIWDSIARMAKSGIIEKKGQHYGKGYKRSSIVRYRLASKADGGSNTPIGNKDLGNNVARPDHSPQPE